MPLPPADPRRPPAGTPQERSSERIAALERRIRNLESYLNGGAVQQIPVVAALPAAGRKGRAVILDSDSKLYRDNGSSWVLIG
jgi:hypothetical protein